MKKRYIVAATEGIFVLLSVNALFVAKEKQETKDLYVGSGGRGVVHVGEATFRVDIADTREKRGLGLSGRPQLADGEGMLFVFPSSGKYPFWMKDMNFPLDIIWIDEHHTIVYIAPFLTPESYPTAYAPEGNAQYVLEVSAGTAAAKGMVVGEAVTFGDE